MLDPKIISTLFPVSYFQRGESYYRNGHVLKFNIDKTGNHITSVVKGSGQQHYNTTINIINTRHGTQIKGVCSCPIGHNCKHVVATLLSIPKPSTAKNIAQPLPFQALSSPQGAQCASVFDQWFSRLEDSFKPTEILTPEKSRKLQCLYVLSLGTKPTLKTTITCILSWVSPSSQQASPYLRGMLMPKKLQAEPLPDIDHQHLTEEDAAIIEALRMMNGFAEIKNNNMPFDLEGANSSTVLQKIVSTGHCCLEQADDSVLTLGEPQNAQFQWTLNSKKNHVLALGINDTLYPDTFILEDTLWYVLKEDLSCGRLETNLPIAMTRMLLQLPELTPEMTLEFSNRITTLFPQYSSLLPLPYNNINYHENSIPQPQLYLSRFNSEIEEEDYAEYDDEFYEYNDAFYDIDSREEPYVTAQITFLYNGYPVSITDPRPQLFHLDDEKMLHIITRDIGLEIAALEKLQQHISLKIFTPENEDSDLFVEPHPSDYLMMIESINNEQDFLKLMMNTLPLIEQQGWKIILDDTVSINLVSDLNVDWYSELEESQYQYFNYELGVLIEGEKINLLPFVVNLLKTTGPELLTNKDDDYRFLIELPDKRTLAIPMSRVRPIMGILIELYDQNGLNNKNTLTLAKHRAALLYEMAKAFEFTQMRWIGGERLRKMGAKLAQFKNIQAVAVPTTFKANLRPYQQDGVNWLQFLREYELAGILADDMGLGKTVQTLAHLCVEKAKRRMKKPSLIIAPTSLMVNWELESQKFAPKLRILICHGEKRHHHHADILKYDVIFTTYPLLVRDKEILIQNEFYYLILDEAQYIKNAKAKSTQIVQQIKAEHRLCLTGTPMENHLGELWSLFHFLMPGFLGDSYQFKQVFRTPIEKNNNAERAKMLSKRVAPFMLRRLKTDVVKELPPKTEIIRIAELQGPQRDLYETIRLAMQKKVQAAIKAKGLSKSHIILLDALLKLRQICCDPRLLSLPSAKKAHKTSAKLELLMELLPNLVEEGRKILLFSQFTSMLALIEKALDNAGLDYVKLTGSTKNRKAPIDAFQSGTIPIFLISLKAGGTGLNLTAADTVIHYDPWWNPAVEDQATDRSHRIGQEKSVFVYKLIAAGTVEETIQEMQKNKRRLMEGLFAERKGSKLSLSTTDIAQLFQPLERDLS